MCIYISRTYITHICICIYTLHIYILVCVCVYLFGYTHYVYIYTYILYIYTHTHTYKICMYIIHTLDRGTPIPADLHSALQADHYLAPMHNSAAHLDAPLVVLCADLVYHPSVL